MPFISQLIGRSGTRSTASPLKPKTVLVIGLGVLMLVAGVCFASYEVPDKELTGSLRRISGSRRSGSSRDFRLDHRWLGRR
jgi:hypothetical protein